MASAAASPKALSLLQRRRLSLEGAPTLLDRPADQAKLAAGPRALPEGGLLIDCGLVAAEAATWEDPFSVSKSLPLQERYSLLQALGQGSMGVVYSATRKADDRQVAVKVMRMHDQELLSIAREEFELLRSVQHSHIIKALDFFTYAMGAVLVMDFFAGTSLETAVSDSPEGRFKEATARALFRALLEAVEHLHQHGILHRDVKAENVLVSADLRDLRLVDFNTARRVLQGGFMSVTGTIDYMPPEALLDLQMTEACDIWAAGLCLHLMLCGALPLARSRFSSREAFGRALLLGARDSGAATAAEHAARWVSRACRESLQQCLQVDPQRRPSASALLSGDWLSSVLPFAD